jgi:hypothetical protein
MVIDETVAMGRSAGLAASEEQGAAMLSSARLSIREFVDEICGTPHPSGYPKPWPWPMRTLAASNPVDLVVAGAQFHKASGFENPLAGDFARAADILFETGLNRLAGSGEQAAVAAGG